MVQQLKWFVLGALVFGIARPAAAQSFNFVHQPTGVNRGAAIPFMTPVVGFTGPYVNVFWAEDNGENNVVRGVRQFPVTNPKTGTNFFEIPDPLTTYPSGTSLRLTTSIAAVDSFFQRPDGIALFVLPKDSSKQPSRTFLIDQATPSPQPIEGFAAVASDPRGILIALLPGDLPNGILELGPVEPRNIVLGSSFTGTVMLEVAPDLLNNRQVIGFHQTIFGGDFAPPTLVASLAGSQTPPTSFAVTPGGIPHVLYADPQSKQLIASEFDPKTSSWQSTQIYDFQGDVAAINIAGAVIPIELNEAVIPIELGANTAFAAWTDVNADDPKTSDLFFAAKLGSSPDAEWKVQPICLGCVGTLDLGMIAEGMTLPLSLTVDPNGLPVIAYVAPDGELMVAYDPPQAAVPEPSSLLLLVAGGLALLARRRPRDRTG